MSTQKIKQTKDFIVKKSKTNLTKIGNQNSQKPTQESFFPQKEKEKLEQKIIYLEQELQFLRDKEGFHKIIERLENYNHDYLQRIQQLEKKIREQERELKSLEKKAISLREETMIAQQKRESSELSHIQQTAQLRHDLTILRNDTTALTPILQVLHQGGGQQQALLLAHLLIATRQQNQSSQGIDIQVIKALPKFKYYPQNRIQNPLNITECSICVQQFTHEGDALRRLPCNHTYHSKCIKPWLMANTCCPYCKYSLK